MRNKIRDELNKIGENETFEARDRAERNGQIISAYYRPKKRVLSPGKLACALSCAAAAAAAVIVLPFALRGAQEAPPLYMDYNYVKTELSLETLGEEAGLKIPAALGGYEVKSTALYYAKDTGRTLVVSVVYEAADDSFLLNVAVDKAYASLMDEYAWFAMPGETATVGGKTIYAGQFGQLFAARYETEDTFVGFRFNNADREDALRIIDEILNG